MISITDNILYVFDKYRKRINITEKFDDTYIRQYIEKCIRNKNKIKLVFPTLHCKSINCDSVFNHLPDASDILAINTIQDIIKDINQVYLYGIKIAIIHESHFYGRVGIVHPDYLLDEYLLDLLSNINTEFITSYSIKDFFPIIKSYDQMRDMFYNKYVPDKQQIEELIQINPTYTKQYLSYICFIKNEFTPLLCPCRTNSSRKAWIKKIAKEQLRIYVGFSKLVNEHFPDYLRVSALYKAPDQIDKLGIELIPQNNTFATPGFNVLYQKSDGNFCLRKLSDIDKNNAVIKYYKGGKYPYYKESKLQPILLLDFDGVMSDNSELLGYNLIVDMLKNKGFNTTLEALITKYLGLKLEHIATALNKEYSQIIIDDNFIEEFRNKYPDYLLNNIGKVDGIDEVLITFKHKYICTSNKKRFIQHFLEKYNFTHLFEDTRIITCDDVSQVKPSPDIYLKAIESAKQNFIGSAEQFIAIEDSIAGVMSAKAAQVHQIIGFVGASNVFNKNIQANNLLEAGASRVFYDMLSLKKYLLKNYYP